MEEAGRLPARRPAGPPAQGVVAVADDLTAGQRRLRQTAARVPLVLRRALRVRPAGRLALRVEGETRRAELAEAVRGVGRGGVLRRRDELRGGERGDGFDFVVRVVVVAYRPARGDDRRQPPGVVVLERGEAGLRVLDARAPPGGVVGDVDGRVAGVAAGLTSRRTMLLTIPAAVSILPRVRQTLFL